MLFKKKVNYVEWNAYKKKINFMDTFYWQQKVRREHLVI